MTSSGNILPLLQAIDRAGVKTFQRAYDEMARELHRLMPTPAAERRHIAKLAILRAKQRAMNGGRDA